MADPTTRAYVSGIHPTVYVEELRPENRRAAMAKATTKPVSPARGRSGSKGIKMPPRDMAWCDHDHDGAY